MDEPAYLEGAVSIASAIEAGVRTIHRILIDKQRQDSSGVYPVLAAARNNNISIETVDADAIDAAAGGRSHGGLLAEVSGRSFLPLEQLARGKQPLIVMLDGVEDPFTLGYSIRALYAAGITGIVLRQREWYSALAVITRSSAGASELMPTAVAEGPEEAAELFRSQSLIISATGKTKGSVSIYDCDWKQSRFLLVGGERRGIKRSFMEQADEILSIPYGRAFDKSMGTVSAASAIAFEALRSRSQH